MSSSSVVDASGKLSSAERARPSLDDRINQHNIWRQLATTGNASYLMVTQPSEADQLRARELGVPVGGPGTFYDETALAVGQPIQFTRTTYTGGIDQFGSGILNRRVENNALTFDVGEQDAYLAWGNYDGKHPQYGYKPFGVAFRWARNGKWYSDVGMYIGRPVPIFLRVRQNQPQSTWKIVTGPNPDYNQVHAGVAPGGEVAEFKVTGTGWQTIPVVYGDKIKNAKGQPAEFRPFGSFVIYPGDRGNHGREHRDHAAILARLQSHALRLLPRQLLRHAPRTVRETGRQTGRGAL